MASEFVLYQNQATGTTLVDPEELVSLLEQATHAAGYRWVEDPAPLPRDDGGVVVIVPDGISYEKEKIETFFRTLFAEAARRQVDLSMSITGVDLNEEESPYGERTCVLYVEVFEGRVAVHYGSRSIDDIIVMLGPSLEDQQRYRNMEESGQYAVLAPGVLIEERELAGLSLITTVRMGRLSHPWP